MIFRIIIILPQCMAVAGQAVNIKDDVLMCVCVCACVRVRVCVRACECECEREGSVREVRWKWCGEREERGGGEGV